MQVDDFDRRCYAVSELLEDVPESPGRPGHPAGSAVVLVTSTRTKEGKILSFAAPSAVALAINIARNAADQAQALRADLLQTMVISPWGDGESIAAESLPALFDYFERSMIVATFSFQALEAFANDVIHRKMETGVYRYEVKKQKFEDLTAIELERRASTEQKLGEVLPKLLRIGSPKGQEVWQNFVGLQRVRNSTLHIKAHDQHVRIRATKDLDTETLFYRFVHDDVSAWPRNAVAMLAYYRHALPEFRWYTCLLREFGFESD